MSNQNCVNKQMKFLILKKIDDNPVYQEQGISSSQLKEELDVNKERYPLVGQQKEGKIKNYGKRLEWMLKTLQEERCLIRRDGIFYPCLRYKDYLLNVASDLYDILEPEVELDGRYYDKAETLSPIVFHKLLADDIMSEKIIASTLKLNQDKEELFFTDSQVKSFIAYLVLYGLIEEIEYIYW